MFIRILSNKRCNHMNTKEKKKQIIISHSFIDEPEFSHSFPTRTTLSISIPKQHDHSKSRSTLTVSRPKQHDPQDKPQQDLATFSVLNTHTLSLTYLYKNPHPYFLPFLKHRFWLFHFLFQTNPNLQNFYKPKWLLEIDLAPSTWIWTPRRSDIEKKRRRTCWPDRRWWQWRANGAWWRWASVSRGKFFSPEWSGIRRWCR